MSGNVRHDQETVVRNRKVIDQCAGFTSPKRQQSIDRIVFISTLTRWIGLTFSQHRPDGAILVLILTQIDYARRQNTTYIGIHVRSGIFQKLLNRLFMAHCIYDLGDTQISTALP